MTDGQLSGRVAVVTGASRGLGAAVAVALADAGAAVGLLGREAAGLDSVRSVLRSRGGQALVLACDVGEPDQVDAAMATVAEELGPVSVLVNNAAMLAPVGAATELDSREWLRALTVNLGGVMACTLAVLPGMRRLGRGAIVNVSSGAAALPGMPWGSAYTVSKAGVEVLTQHLHAELAPAGIAVTAVRPGRVDTRMQEQLRDEALVGPQLAARHREWRERGNLLDPAVPARLVLATCLAGNIEQRVISVYDDVGKALVAGLPEVECESGAREPMTTDTPADGTL